MLPKVRYFWTGAFPVYTRYTYYMHNEDVLVNIIVKKNSWRAMLTMI